jgi:hypothetical protein
MLELIIQRCKGGLSNIYPSSNTDYKWDKSLSDLREELGDIYNAGNSAIVRAIMVTHEGYCLGLLRQILGGRTNDYIAAWLFIPAQEKISGSELGRKMELLGDILRDTSNLGEQKELLEQIGKSGEKKPFADVIKLPEGTRTKYAIRKYGGSTGVSLMELYDKLYQSEYMKYKTVFLVEDSPEFRVPSTMDKLTGKPLEDKAAYSLPTIPHGYHLILKGGKYDEEPPALQPLMLEKEQLVQLKIEREDFISKDKTYLPNDLGEVDVKALEWEMEVKRSFFRIIPGGTAIPSKSKRGRPNEPAEVKDAIIYINGKELTNHNHIVIGENKEVKIEVTAPRYDKWERHNESLSRYVHNPLEIRLKKATFTHIFKFNVDERYPEPSELSFELYAKDKFDKSPLEGYKFVGEQRENLRDNNVKYKLQYDKWALIKKPAFIIIAALVAIVLLAGGALVGFMLA